MLQNGKWTDFASHSSIDDAADQVTLNLADGGAGDTSGTDGVINDPVGSGTPAAAGTITAYKIAKWRRCHHLQLPPPSVHEQRNLGSLDL